MRRTVKRSCVTILLSRVSLRCWDNLLDYTAHKINEDYNKMFWLERLIISARKQESKYLDY